jgi:signal transduction histidine kinase
LRCLSLILTCCVFYFNLSFANSVIVDTNNIQEIINISDYAFLTTFDSESITSDEFINSNWEKGNSAQLGVVKKEQWIKFDFNNNYNFSIERCLYIPYHHINKIDVFHYKGDSLLTSYFSGTSRSYSSKVINSRSYPFKFNFIPGTTTVYFKIKHDYLPLRAAVYMISEDNTIESINTSEKNIWFWRGILFFAMLISIIIFVATKQRLFLYYFLLNLGVCLFIGSEIGDFFLFFDIDIHNHNLDIKHLGNWLVLFIFPLFLDELTPVKKRNRRLWNTLMILIYVGPVLWLVCLVPGVKESNFLLFTTYYFLLVSPLVLVLEMVFLIKCLINKDSNALALIIIYVVYILAVIINIILPALGFMSDKILVYSGLMFGSMFEVSGFMFIMGRQTFNIYRDKTILIQNQKNHQLEITKTIIDSQEKERNNIGTELHDMIGANISIAKWNVPAELTKVHSLLDATISSVRDISHGLITPVIRDNQFVDQVKELCVVCSTDKIEVNHYFHEWDGVDNPKVTFHLYRIIQELITNSIKHGKASNIFFQCLKIGDILNFSFEDNGVGIKNLNSENGKNGKGLENIYYRVALLNGEVHFESEKGSGFYGFIEIDLNKVK